jgi:cyclic pyranopterin phosphate synthase
MAARKDVKMVDVSGKRVTSREATAKGRVTMRAETAARIRQGRSPKGDVLTAAKLAGIMAAKETHRLVPLCHPLSIENISLELTLEDTAVDITATVGGRGKTGFEMEALTAVAIAALTVYDMCKGIDASMRLQDIRLVRKSGGKSGTVVLE